MSVLTYPFFCKSTTSAITLSPDLSGVFAGFRFKLLALPFGAHFSGLRLSHSPFHGLGWCDWPAWIPSSDRLRDRPWPGKHSARLGLQRLDRTPWLCEHRAWARLWEAPFEVTEEPLDGPCSCGGGAVFAYTTVEGIVILGPLLDLVLGWNFLLGLTARYMPIGMSC